jgi:hypothetical protein
MPEKLPDPTKPSTRVTEAKAARTTDYLPSGIDDPTKISTSSTPAPADDDVELETKERETEKA